VVDLNGDFVGVLRGDLGDSDTASLSYTCRSAYDSDTVSLVFDRRRMEGRVGQDREDGAMKKAKPAVGPESAEVRALLEAAGLTAYAAAKLLRVNARHLQRVVSGEPDPRSGRHYVLNEAVWQLMQLVLVQSRRDELPPAPVKDFDWPET